MERFFTSLYFKKFKGGRVVEKDMISKIKGQ